MKHEFQHSTTVRPVVSVKPRDPSAGSSLDFALLKHRSQQARSNHANRRPTLLRSRLKGFRRLLVERSAELAEQIAVHRGCTTTEALATEILPLADATRFLERNFARILAPKRLGSTDRPGWMTGVDSEVHRQPFGLVLVIAPGNYPLYLAAVQALQALTAGNAVWIKPAPGTFGLLQTFRELLMRAGTESDLIHVLPDTVEAARAAIEAGMDKVVFTGSAATGRMLLAQLAPRLTPAVMELSGCDAVFLRPDADIQLAARSVSFGLNLNRGATCIAPRRIFVPRSLLAEFTRALHQELKNHPTIKLGSDAVQRWLPWVREALADGAFIVSGTLHAEQVTAPLILSGTHPGMKLLQDDTFAAVACIVPVDTEEEALTADSQCAFALGASVFGRDAGAAARFASSIRAGSVVINDLIAPTADPRLPFGGMGQSGFGVTRGAEGLLEMTAPKVIITNRSRLRPHHRPFLESDAPLFQSLLRMSHGASWIERTRALFRALSQFRKQSRFPNQTSI